MKTTYQGKDQNWQDAATTYWFDVNGETYGIVESGCDTTRIVDFEGCPITGYANEEEISNALENAVIEDMRAE